MGVLINRIIYKAPHHGHPDIAANRPTLSNLDVNIPPSLAVHPQGHPHAHPMSNPTNRSPHRTLSEESTSFFPHFAFLR
ncbi:hypothetical protein DSO57_1024000 [Entomophthora muscae]|uniref:Uncharacterized protein n=1 Tax=Entomophthora muscae TaxID=34485 RepID=A0ACC2SG41_9FUNG|nr:hypothetical protein DSO57_1024000 [Entomophthora muscae]